MNVLGPVLAALLAGVYVDVPKSAVKSVHFLSPSLAVSTAKVGGPSVIHGPLRIDMAFAAQTVRKPLLRIVCLCEVSGELVWMDGMWDRPGTNVRLSRSTVSAAFKAAGRDACSEPACISSVMSDASARAYMAATYGEPDNTKGFFRLDRSPTAAKLLLYRFEIWQNGVLADAWESSRAGLGPYDIPRDWFVRGRYQGRFRYAKGY